MHRVMIPRPLAEATFLEFARNLIVPGDGDSDMAGMSFSSSLPCNLLLMSRKSTKHGCPMTIDWQTRTRV